ncbi:phage tail protein [Flavobacterium nitrogenifigens]|uniref:Microcystin-dependent protein n=1 Tax=Flavobacterium nitrogenifigens TaxID=1617283 RepID=A0A521F436_9FLAO|nr:tail fiber protein [Flavobacterium nitrogenifigens]KAF2339702.1 phage tail protein [Flavobacterium nitrogenifigens]SMO90945.1 Microcystin-dependent protein [Flavobacterium nitrogenifigens]
MEGTVGEIRHFAANFVPRSWASCNGQILPIQRYTALFSIIGTVYGGNGSTTFGLPDFVGRVAIGFGNGNGLTPYELGEMAGTNGSTLTLSNLPIHNHTAAATIKIPAYSDTGDSGTPDGNVLAAKASMYSTLPGDTTLKAASFTVTTGRTGDNVPLSIMQPSIGMNYIICLEGAFPSRN